MSSEDSRAREAASQPFQVNLQAVVELLSRNIYSHPSVFLRELIQNGRDAIQARVEVEGFHVRDGRISITPTSGDHDELVVRDNGIGMSAREVAALLATVGQSSKRDIFDLPRSDRLGQFGIGLLSCFMVADEICVETRPAAGGSASRWVGSSQGTFTVTELSEEESRDIPGGTTVRLRPRGAERELTTYARVWDLAVQFAEFLPVTVEVLGPRGSDRYVNRDAMFSRLIGSHVPSQAEGAFEADGAGSSDELAAHVQAADLESLMEYGRELIGAVPLAAIPLDVPQTGTRATAFVLPVAPSPGSRQGARCYLGGLLVGESVPDVVPPWAFFVRVVLDSTGLTPTASREGFVRDEALALTTREFARQLRAWIMTLAAEDRIGLQAFLHVHDLALRSLATHDEELAALIVPLLTFETSQGRMLLEDVIRSSRRIRFAETVEEFRQIAAVVPSDQIVVNAGYVYEAELMRILPHVVEGTSSERVRVQDMIAQFAKVPGDARQAAEALEARARTALWGLDCEVEVRAFTPSDVSALYVVDPHVLRSMELRRLEEETSGFWGDLMREISEPGLGNESGGSGVAGEDAAHAAGAFATLVLNWNSPVTAALATAEDDLVASRTVRLLYVQAMLAGHNPLRPADRALLNESLADMLALSTGILQGKSVSPEDFLRFEE